MTEEQPKTQPPPMTRDEWLAEAMKRFGKDPRKWRFVCPVCKTVQSIEDFLEQTELDKERILDVIGFSCIGRWAKGGCEHQGLSTEPVEKGADSKPAMGCDYAGGGLFRLNPVKVEWEGEVHGRFAFAEDD